MSKSKRFVGLAAAGGLVTGALYLRWLRPWQLTWGATAQEVGRPLPGDELIEHPSFTATRAITIAATPEEIWPWLLQVGVTRGGWYSYDLLDNLGRPSADRILPDFQGLEVGDVIPMSPDGKQGLLVHELDLPRSMTWVTPGATSWAWVAEPQADGTTRLITRIRSRYRWLSPSIAFSALIEFGDIWMMRKMLRTIRERVEGDSPPLAEPSPPQASGGSLSPFPGGRLLPRPLQASVRTAVFFLKVLPMLPSGVVDLLTARPIVDQVTYPTRLGSAVGDLYRPATSMPVPGIVVCLGVVPFGVDHPQVARLGEALARSGLAALLYWSPAMRDRRLDPEDTQGLALAYEWLVDQTYIDESRSGLLGTCVGGAFALMAAAQPSIRDRVAFVAAFAPYSSMWTFARDIASSSRTSNGNTESWDVDPLTRDVFVRSVIHQLPPDEREVVRARLEDEWVVGDSGSLSPDAEAVLRLLTVRSRDEADRALEALPAPMRDHLTALSPLIRAHEIHAPLILLGHDRDDQVVPVEESRRLQQALADRSGVHYTEFALFQHATPRRLSLLPLTAQLAKFYRYAYPIFRATS